MQPFYILPIDASLQAPGTFPINQDFSLALLAQSQEQLTRLTQRCS